MNLLPFHICTFHSQFAAAFPSESSTIMAFAEKFIMTAEAIIIIDAVVVGFWKVEGNGRVVVVFILIVKWHLNLEECFVLRIRCVDLGLDFIAGLFGYSFVFFGKNGFPGRSLTVGCFCCYRFYCCFGVSLGFVGRICSKNFNQIFDHFIIVIVAIAEPFLLFFVARFGGIFLLKIC